MRIGAPISPGRLFPADELFIRLSCQGTNGHIQVNSFEFESRLAKSPPDTEGATYFLEVQRASPEVAVSLQNVQRPIEDGLWLLEWATTNRTKAPLNLQAALGLDSAPLTQFQKQKVAPLARAEWKLSCAEGDSGDYDLSVRFQDDRGRALFAGRVPVSSSFLSDPRPGYLLPGIQGRKQVVALENEAEVPQPKLLALGVAHLPQVFAVNLDIAQVFCY